MIQQQNDSCKESTRQALNIFESSKGSSKQLSVGVRHLEYRRPWRFRRSIGFTSSPVPRSKQQATLNHRKAASTARRPPSGDIEFSFFPWMRYHLVRELKRLMTCC